MSNMKITTVGGIVHHFAFLIRSDENGWIGVVADDSSEVVWTTNSAPVIPESLEECLTLISGWIEDQIQLLANFGVYPNPTPTNPPADCDCALCIYH